jgi:RNA polymerase sigma-70 factor (ECF subfamily)
MTTLGRGPAPVTAPLDDTDWVAALSIPGPEQDRALVELHALLLRAARRQVQRMGTADADELANQAADEALMALLAKLHTFEGRSRFTTWAYKFAVLQAATAVRTLAWQDREIHLDGLELLADGQPGPGQYAEAADLADAVRSALATALSPHQRRIVLALLVDEVPIDVLAERLGTNRNALYKALHDARKRLRGHLREAGFLEEQAGTP